MDEWVGVVGTVVGVVLASINSWIIQRWWLKRQDGREDRQRELAQTREDRQRWHERRLQAYATTPSRLTTVVAVTRAGITAARPLVQPPWGPYRLRRQMGVAQTALEEPRNELEVIRIVGGQRVVAATDRCVDVLGEVSEKLSTWSRAIPDSIIDDLLAQLQQAKAELRTTARAELDVENLDVSRNKAADLE